ncbi:hypothetical protein [Photobacterium sp. 1_MG-2023]|uniref:hypothetical protein n=1 Tax=Photobacterium sp. 1_MG-2023 TaxID=3062646 RepID=UPI0026E434B5|nr:hypothetical protein [Photobacterium sp. 1_MG-2023]MDO6706895.1 hypothetical protein [Photobacterium sp. 1_MG-2023]
MNKHFFIIFIVIFISPSQTFASNGAWLFAHRANSPEAVNHAIDDHLNAIEVDISLAKNIPAHRRCTRDLWCAYHRGDTTAYNLSDVLETALTGTGVSGINNSQIGAVWLDVKTGHATHADYQALTHIVFDTLGTGDNTVRKYWGVWPASQLNTTYTQVVRNEIVQRNLQKESTFIIEADSNQDTNLAAQQCQSWGLQCGLSAGNPFLGDLGTHTGPSWDMNNLNYLSGDISHKSHINSIFLWTFNWNGLYEDDMIRLLFGHRSHWEYLAGFNWQCGQEGNGIILGAINSVYPANFCTEADGNDACSIATEAIFAGPLTLGDRYTDLSQPRNQYASSNPLTCNAYYPTD